MSAFFVSGCDGAQIFQAVLARILTLGADAPDTSCLNLLPVMASTVSAVYAHGSGTFSGATSTGTWYTNGVKYLPAIGRVAALAGGDEDGQWQAVAIDA